MMDSMVLHFFCDEMQKTASVKTAGVELSLVGYHRDPVHPQKAEHDAKASAYWAAHDAAVGKFPPIDEKRHGTLHDVFFGGPRKRAERVKEYQAHSEAWQKEHPRDFEDTDQYAHGSRIHLPSEPYGKFAGHVLGTDDEYKNLPVKDTDLCYSDEPYENRFGREDIHKLIEHYDAALRRNKWLLPEEKEDTQFQEHAKALAAHPDLKFARLEWH